MADTSSSAPSSSFGTLGPSAAPAPLLAVLTLPALSAPRTDASTLAVLRQTASSSTASSSAAAAARESLLNGVHIPNHFDFKLNIDGSNFPKWKNIFHTMLYQTLLENEFPLSGQKTR